MCWDSGVGLRLLVASTRGQPLREVLYEAHVEIGGRLLQVAVWLGEHREIGKRAVSVKFYSRTAMVSKQISPDQRGHRCLLGSIPVELYNGHAPECSCCRLFRIRYLDCSSVSSAVGES